MYCGACGIYVATRDGNEKFKEKLAAAYGAKPEDLVCEGCLSERVWGYCQVCSIRSCCRDRKIENCYQCNEFPCKLVDDFPIPVGKKVILRSVPRRREVGTGQWMAEEEKRYICPHCGYPQFRGVKKCRQCKQAIDLD